MKKRRLSDLYVRGRELSVSDGEGEPVKIWLAKLNELDRETAVRRANAAKARYLIDGDNEEGDRFVAAYGEMREIEEREDLVIFLIADDVAKARRRIEAQLAADEETWGKDDYLQGLLDAWLGDEESPGLGKAQMEDPQDPEAKRVWSEIDRYQQEVTKAIRAESDSLMKDFDDLDLDDIRRKAAHKLLELRANEEFTREFQRQQLFFAVRDVVNRRQRYFSAVSELDDLDDELRTYLAEQFADLMVDRVEGKDSPPPADSSTSSDSEDQDSGLVTASA